MHVRVPSSFIPDINTLIMLYKPSPITLSTLNNILLQFLSFITYLLLYLCSQTIRYTYYFSGSLGI